MHAVYTGLTFFALSLLSLLSLPSLNYTANMISTDRSSPIPLANQIEAQLRAQIKSRALPGGARLMSSRQLATQLAVSPNTVVLAYGRLVAAGIIDSQGTAGFFVCQSKDGERAAPDDIALEAGEEQEPVWLAQQANDQRAGVLLASSGALPPTWHSMAAAM